MGFADILNQEQQKIEQGNNNNEGVKYPESKHKRLFFAKGERELLVQVLPTADLFSLFAKPTRKIFLTATTTKGKKINSNFTLDAQPNPGSALEAKITEWAQKRMIPNGFGGQTSPKRYHTVNVVKIVQNPTNPQQWMQERDTEGNLVVRLFDMPHSAYSNYITKLRDPFLNTSGTELSFMHPEKAAVVKISKPAPGGMEYGVEVYTNFLLPPLGQGWESQLEDLDAHTQATERLENGQDWVNAFIDMKEGRAPQRPGQQSQQAVSESFNPFATQQPAANPFATEGNVLNAPSVTANPFATTAPAQQSQANPFMQTTAPTQPAANPFASQPAPATVQQPTANPFTSQPAPATPAGNTGGLQFDSLPDFGADLTTQTSNPTQPAHAQTNNNGLPDIEAMLEAELNKGL